MSVCMETDAITLGLGAVLSQMDVFTPSIAYASRKFHLAEEHYAITELETLGRKFDMEVQRS